MKSKFNVFSLENYPESQNQAEKLACYMKYDTLLILNDKFNFIGRGKSGIWCAGININEPYRMILFLNYEEHNKRKVIIWSKDLKHISNGLSILKQLNYKNEIKLFNENDFLCHSTTIESFVSILKDKAVYSYSELQKRNHSIKTYRKELKEPKDYFKYIDLCKKNSISSEIVVASRQFKHINDSFDIKYKPGVRMYFKGSTIRKVKGCCSDGLHVAMVYKKIPIKYAEFFIISYKSEFDRLLNINNFSEKKDILNKIIFLEEREYWTPKEFIEKCNNIIMNYKNR